MAGSAREQCTVESFLRVLDFLVMLTVCLSANFDTIESSKCDTCKELTRRFNEGIENTVNSNFGGGNTHWEERKLGSFTFSETRLIEILEHSCEDGSKECYHMLEENEEVLEHWWFSLFAKGKETDLSKYLCQNLLKVCCPEGTYGPECIECPTGKTRPCSGNGICQGSGTREGSGTCACHPGYLGELCDECSTSRYFEEVKNETHVICTACHFSCETTCHGAGSSMCDDCIYGWSLIEGGGCIECDVACNGSCTGTGAENCIECKQKYFHDGTACKACHVSCATNCTDDSSKSCDECAAGWSRAEDESGCQDVDECSEDSNKCASESYCLNNEGSFSCPKCDRTCTGCDGPTNKDCKDCRAGYAKNEENECHDIDECHASDVCTGVGERCVNNIGSYKCECQKGFVRKSGKCEVKRKGGGKKKDNPKEETKLPEISPESLADEIKKMGEPVQGVKIDDEEMVSMGGNFEIPKQNPSNVKTEEEDADETTDSTRNTREHDDL